MSNQVDGDKGIAIVADGGPELIHVPSGTQIAPTSPLTPQNVEIKHIDILHHRYLSDQELRKMVRELVAEELAKLPERIRQQAGMRRE